MSSSHQFRDHTGEVELALAADSLAEIYVQAAFALTELCLNARPDPPPSAPAIEIRLAARDAATLLVDWLNELVFRCDVDRMVFTDVRVEMEPVDSGCGLVARLRGLADAELAGQVKAATLHRARVERTPEGFVGNVVLDV